MRQERKIQPVVRKFSSFQEADEAQIEDYANTDWKTSVSIVEGMRKLIWNDEYKEPRKFFVVKSSLKEDRDDFE